MVMTMLETEVAQDKWTAPEKAYQDTSLHLDPGLVRTCLVRGVKEPTLWRIITVRESREAPDKMRQSNETPRRVLMFRAANAEPTLAVFDIAAQRVA